MRINVAQLMRGPVGAVRSYEVAETAVTGEGGAQSVVRGEVSLMRTGRGILVSGVLDTGVEVNCSRCLKAVSCPLTLSIREEYFPTIDVVSGAPIELPEDEPACFTIDQHHEIDLEEAIRQYAIMALPMKPLCREDCAGLCATCGCDLNRGRCDCATERIDPRWQELFARVNKRKGK